VESQLQPSVGGKTAGKGLKNEFNLPESLFLCAREVWFSFVQKSTLLAIHHKAFGCLTFS